jgi:methyl-accepting chemotaxis protein/methyl-accepting chemotaxis protein-1 (serine sensor receptor)
VREVGSHVQAYEPVLQKIIASVQEGRNQSAGFKDLLNEWASLGGQMIDSAKECEERGTGLALRGTGSASLRLGNSVIIALLAVVIGFGSGILAAFILVRSLNKQLRAVTAELANGAAQVASAASQVASSSEALAQGASEQAASLEETSASTEEINTMASRNADSSKAIANLMVSTTHRIGEGNRKLEEMVASMQHINTSSEKISKIIKTIDEIAFQTNILALNAAVEAARAGESGMGFAVVADEVRNLAQRCSQAAKDTAGLIEESISSSHEGSTKLAEVTKAIGAITEEVSKVSELVEEVSLGSQEQSKGLDQIAKGISQMEQVTQKTASAAEESASAGEELNAQSQTLHGIVQQLAALVDSSGRRAALALPREAKEAGFLNRTGAYVG